MQRLYLKAAQPSTAATRGNAWLLGEWEKVLNDLERDAGFHGATGSTGPRKISALLVSQEEKTGVERSVAAGDRPRVSQCPARPGTVSTNCNGRDRCAASISEEEIKDAIFSPPETTRAFFRGRAVARFNHAISSIQWDEIAFSKWSEIAGVKLPEVRGA